MPGDVELEGTGTGAKKTTATGTKKTTTTGTKKTTATGAKKTAGTGTKKTTGTGTGAKKTTGTVATARKKTGASGTRASTARKKTEAGEGELRTPEQSTPTPLYTESQPEAPVDGTATAATEATQGTTPTDAAGERWREPVVFAAGYRAEADTTAQQDRERYEKTPPPTPVREEKKETPLPAAAGEHGVETATPPVRFPEEIARHGILTRLALLAVVAVVLLAAALIFFLRPAGYTEQIYSVQYLYQQEEDRTLILINGEEEGSFSGRLAEDASDGRGYTHLARTESGELYLIRGSRIRWLAGNISGMALATEGKTLAYRTDEGVLYRQNTGKKDLPELVSKGVTEDPFCLSPNGKELLYTSSIDGKVRMEVSSADGKAPYLTDTADYRPVAIANGCEYLYFYNSGGNLLIYCSETARRIDCGSFLPGSLVFNRELDEVMLRDAERTRYYRCGEAMNFVGLSGNRLLTLVPNQRVASREVVGGVQYLQKTLLKNYYTCEQEGAIALVYLKETRENAQLTTIHFVDATEVVSVTDKYVFFLSTDVTASDTHCNLFFVKTGKTEAVRLMSDVVEYRANVDGSRVLFRDVHGPLRSVRLGSASQTPIHLADEIQPGTLTVTQDDVFFYLTPDGALYRSDNGAMPERVAEQALWVATDAHVALFALPNGERVEIYTNYRNRRKNEQVLSAPMALSPAEAPTEGTGDPVPEG